MFCHYCHRQTTRTARIVYNSEILIETPLCEKCQENGGITKLLKELPDTAQIPEERLEYMQKRKR